MIRFLSFKRNENLLLSVNYFSKTFEKEHRLLEFWKLKRTINEASFIFRNCLI